MLGKHDKIEKNSMLMLILIIIVISIGGLIEIVPLFRQELVIEKVEGMRPYTPLELAGYNIYIREGCYGCHSQQIRPLREEVERYGHYSLAAESMYDFPFQWGSKRTGPDLARVGGKYSDAWHKAHLTNPRDVVPESIMPTYAFMNNRAANINHLDKDLKTLKIIGVPYSKEMIENATSDAMSQANGGDVNSGYGDNVTSRDFDGQKKFVSEMDALISYLQVLGTMVDFSSEKK